MPTDPEVIEDIVDEFVDDLDPSRIERQAALLDITVKDLVSRINTELWARININD